MSAASRLSAAFAASLALAVPASAQVTFTGFTNGCFYTAGGAACTPENTNTVKTDVQGPLTYTNSTFNVTTVNNTAAIGNIAGPVNVDNLGSFAFPAGPVTLTDYANQRFVLNVNFTGPAGVNTGNNLFTAVLTGSVNQTAGGVSFDFDNAPRTYNYTGGSFTLRVDDVSLTKNMAATSIAVSGFITATPTTVVPEPSTYVLMAAGLAGMFVVARRKRAA